MTRQEIERILEKREKDYRRFDVSSLTADHAAEGVVESPFSGTVRGRTAIRRIYEAVFAAFPDLQLHNDYVLIDDRQAAVFWTAKGTHMGTFLGLAGTGKRFEVCGVFMYRFDANQIVHERRIYDFTSLLLQVGILKARPA